MASFEKEEMEEKESGDGHVLARYLMVMLLLLPVVIGILFFTFKIAFAEKDQWNKVAGVGHFLAADEEFKAVRDVRVEVVPPRKR